MHYFSSFYSVTIPRQVSGLLVAHHQEVKMYICDNWYVVYLLTVSWPGCGGCTNCCIYTFLPPDDGQLASPKHVEVSY
jgi:hypothetical protein